VLISTAHSVREQAQSTGEDAIANVASGFIIQGIIGEVNDTSNQIDNLTIYVKLAAGSPAIDMSNVVIFYTDGEVMRTLSKGDEATNDTFKWEAVSGETGDDRVPAGVLVNITIGTQRHTERTTSFSGKPLTTGDVEHEKLRNVSPIFSFFALQYGYILQESKR